MDERNVENQNKEMTLDKVAKCHMRSVVARNGLFVASVV